MKTYHSFCCIVIILAIVFPFFLQAQENNTELPKEIQDAMLFPGVERISFTEELAKPPNPNIKIKIKGKLGYSIKPDENYNITWIIKGLEEGQEVTQTGIHWAYLADMNTTEEINDYKKYPNKGREFTGYQDEYTDRIYIYPYTEKLPAIMLVVHAVIDGQNYVFGPVAIDIIHLSDKR